MQRSETKRKVDSWLTQKGEGFDCPKRWLVIAEVGIAEVDYRLVFNSNLVNPVVFNLTKIRFWWNANWRSCLVLFKFTA